MDAPDRQSRPPASGLHEALYALAAAVIWAAALYGLLAAPAPRTDRPHILAVAACP